MNTSQDFNRLYTDVSGSIAAAMTEIANLDVDHKDGKQELTNMMDRLHTIHQRFNGELSLLEQHAEWDKFTMAFFGETNAGKSTIIESLRILFKEDSREQLLKENAYNQLKFEQAMFEHLQIVRQGMLAVYEEYVAEIALIHQSANVLSQVVHDESSARVKSKMWQFAIAGMILGAVVSGSIAALLKG